MTTREPIRAIRLQDGTYYVPGDVQTRRPAPVAPRATVTPAVAVRTGAVAAGVTVGAGVLGGIAWAVTEAVSWVVAHVAVILGVGAAVVLLLVVAVTTRAGSSCSTTVTFKHRH